MATRKGATKTDSRGRRFRYDGRRWVRIKATGNGNNTSSARNRSARQGRSNATVTNSDNRRSSQSSRSNRVSNSGQRTNTGSARVTGLNAQQRRRLPRGQRGGDLARQGGERVSTGRRVLPPASSTSLGSGTNQRINGTRTQGQGGNPRSTGARVTSSDNQSSRSSGSSTQQRGGQGGSRRLTGQGQRPQLPAGRNSSNTSRSSSNTSRGNDSGNQFRAGNERNRTGTGGRSTGGVGRGRVPISGGSGGIGPGGLKGGVANLLAGIATTWLAENVVKPIGYYGSAPIRRAMGGGPPRLDIDGNPIIRPGVNAPGSSPIMGPDGEPAFSNYAGPGGDPSGSGRQQAQQGNYNQVGLRSPDGSPLSPVPQLSTAPLSVQQPSAPINGGNVPAPIPMAAPAASGGVRDTSVYDGMTADQKMAAWAELFPLLAAKVKPGQAGYSAINPSGPPAQQPNPAMTGEGAPGAQSGGRPVQIGEEVPFVDPMSGAQLNISRQMTPEERRRMRRGYPASNNYFA